MAPQLDGRAAVSRRRRRRVHPQDARRGSLLTTYFDTSAIVASLAPETDTDRVRGWLAAQPVDDSVVSSWVITEFSSAMSLKVRTGQLNKAARDRATAGFARLVRRLQILEVLPADFRMAAGFAERDDLGLRAGDALHLAICADRELRLCTLDKRMARAAARIGVEVLAP